MKRRTTLATIGASLLLVAFVASTGAQTIKSVAGTYSAVTVPAYGEKPRGRMVLGADGNFSIIITRATLPKIAANSRTKGTAEENKAIVEGSIAYFGKYTIDDGGKAITFNIETSTFPNWEGTASKRAIKAAGDGFTYTVSAPSAGGPAADVVWKRIK
jgi:hypothetical protein